MAGVQFGCQEGEVVGQTESEIFANVRNVHFIDVKGASDLFGHTYYRDNPVVLSDIALLIGTGAAPGSETRPLASRQKNFREIPEGYSAVQAEQIPAER
ncbi:hypothetical protein [Ruegeria arenilitoris]|uniref:hypothetical protein n=1 Tax=Ruegeria arenilitoris TaxID=1173585 RepID=UPI0020C2D321